MREVVVFREVVVVRGGEGRDERGGGGYLALR